MRKIFLASIFCLVCLSLNAKRPASAFGPIPGMPKLETISSYDYKCINESLGGAFYIDSVKQLVWIGEVNSEDGIALKVNSFAHQRCLECLTIEAQMNSGFGSMNFVLDMKGNGFKMSEVLTQNGYADYNVSILKETIVDSDGENEDEYYFCKKF